MTYYKKHIFLCTNKKVAGKACCANTGGDEFFDYFKSCLLELELHGIGAFRISKSGCLGRCAAGPCVVIYPEGVWYKYASFADIDAIIENHLIQDKQALSLLIDQQISTK